MPIYDYVCSACGHRIEVIHGIHDQGPRFCPQCGREGTMTKAVSAPSVHFKGSGWAKKDRTSAARKQAKTTDEAAPAATDSKAGKESGDGDGGAGTKEKAADRAVDKPSAGGSADKPSSSSGADKSSGGGSSNTAGPRD